MFISEFSGDTNFGLASFTKLIYLMIKYITIIDHFAIWERDKLIGFDLTILLLPRFSFKSLLTHSVEENQLKCKQTNISQFIHSTSPRHRSRSWFIWNFFFAYFNFRIFLPQYKCGTWRKSRPNSDKKVTSLRAVATFDFNFSSLWNILVLEFSFQNAEVTANRFEL